MYEVPHRMELKQDLSILLVVAIAGTEYLLEYILSKCKDVEAVEYADHHQFTTADIAEITKQFQLLPDKNKIILTTEKDALRLDIHRDELRRSGLPIYILPVGVEFLGQDPSGFDHTIKEWLLNFKR